MSHNLLLMFPFMQIAIFVSSTDAVQSGWLLSFLKGISSTQIREMRRNLVEVCDCKICILICCRVVLPSSCASFRWKNKFFTHVVHACTWENFNIWSTILISFSSQNYASLNIDIFMPLTIILLVHAEKFSV